MKFYGKKTLAAALIGGAFSLSLWGSSAKAQQLPPQGVAGISVYGLSADAQCLPLGGKTPIPDPYGSAEKYFEIAKNLDIFATLFKEVNTFYVDEVTPAELMNVGITAMLENLDPYTNYIPEDRIEDYRTMTTGEYGGIGAVVGKKGTKMTVIMPNEGFAAHKAGLQIGDEILSIDGVDVNEKNVGDVSKLLRGQADTEVKLKVRRYGEKNILDINIIREKITINNVPYFGMVTEDIGLIQLMDFTRNASREVKNAVNDLKDKGAKKIIIDLRGNPGGLLNEAIDISNLFVDKGLEIVSTKGKVKDWNKVHYALNQPLDTEIPLAVLTNGSSASASEIVSGVIQDYDRGVLIGQTTFGKGLVQATRSLSYNSKLKVTVAKYYIPSGRCIQSLDYAHRSEDGTVNKIPDSLMVAFKTKNGRTVYDGRGVKPDLEIQNAEYSEIVAGLVQDGKLFDYATIYKHKNPTVASAKEFSLSDKDYADFCAWLNGQEFNYSTPLEKSVSDLEASMKKEATYDAMKGHLDELKKAVEHNKDQDLQKYKKEVIEFLEEEIISRYYLEKGTIEASFDNDPDVLKAIEVLNDNAKYKQILKKQ